MVGGCWGIKSKLEAVVRRRLDWGSRILRCVDAPFDALMRLLMGLLDQDHLVEDEEYLCA